MDKLQCTNCGGHINPRTNTCEYCGTKYMRPKSEIQPIYIEYERPGVHSLGARIAIDPWTIKTLGEEETSRMCMERITHELAKSLTPFVEIYTDHDIQLMQTTITGRIRVLEPSYRF